MNQPDLPIVSPGPMSALEVALSAQLAAHPDFRPTDGMRLCAVLATGAHPGEARLLSIQSGTAHIAVRDTAAQWFAAAFPAGLSRSWGAVLTRVPHLRDRTTVGALLLDLIDRAGSVRIVAPRACGPGILHVSACRPVEFRDGELGAAVARALLAEMDRPTATVDDEAPLLLPEDRVSLTMTGEDLLAFSRDGAGARGTA